MFGRRLVCGGLVVAWWRGEVDGERGRGERRMAWWRMEERNLCCFQYYSVDDGCGVQMDASDACGRSRDPI